MGWNTTNGLSDKAFRRCSDTTSHSVGFGGGHKIGHSARGHAQFMEVGRELSDGAVGGGWGTLAQLLSSLCGNALRWGLEPVPVGSSRGPIPQGMFGLRHAES